MALKECCPAQGGDLIVLTDAQAGTPLGNGAQAFGAGTNEQDVFQQFSLRPQVQLEVADGTIGNRMRHVSQADQTTNDLAGQAQRRLSIEAASRWLPRIIGDISTVNPDVSLTSDIEIVPDGSVPRFSMLTNTVGGYFEYQDVQVSQAVISGSSGQPINLQMDLRARDYVHTNGAAAPAKWPASLPGVLSTDAFKSLVFAEMEIQKGSDTYCIDNFNLTINNQLEAKFYNSITPRCVAAKTRIVTVGFAMPWNTDIDLDWFGQGDVGTTVVLRFVKDIDGTNKMTVTVTLGRVKWPDNGPTVTGDEDIGYQIEGQSFAAGAGDDTGDAANYPDIFALIERDPATP